MTVTRDMVGVIWNGFAIALRLDTCGDLHDDDLSGLTKQGETTDLQM